MIDAALLSDIRPPAAGRPDRRGRDSGRRSSGFAALPLAWEEQGVGGMTRMDFARIAGWLASLAAAGGRSCLAEDYLADLILFASDGAAYRVLSISTTTRATRLGRVRAARSSAN